MKKLVGLRYSDAEITMQPIDREAWSFEEKGRTAVVQVERLSGVPSRVIYASAIEGWTTGEEAVPPLHPISEAEKTRIGQALAAHLEKHGYPVEID